MTTPDDDQDAAPRSLNEAMPPPETLSPPDTPPQGMTTTANVSAALKQPHVPPR